MTGAHIEQVAHGILAQPAFRTQGKGLLQRILDRIGSWITGFFDHLFTAAGHGGIASVLSMAVVAAVAAAVVLLIVHVARNRARAGGVAATSALKGEPSFTATDWLARAVHAEASGDFNEALRCRYRACVVLLATERLVEEIPGGTAGEYRSQVVRTAPAVYADFAALSGSFEEAWYAGALAGPVVVGRARSRNEAIAAAVSRMTGSPATSPPAAPPP